MSNSKKRKLRAILFADIVGYTALMQKDEAQASELLQKFRHTLNEKVAQQNGEIINNYGDGCLCTFESAVDAMTCAKEVQLIFQTTPKVPVRIGLHSGDVFFEDDNVFGDSVNIASRIESLGLAGAVLFSKQIKRHIANQTEFKVQSLGEFDFKNVEKTMEVFGLANEGFLVPKAHQIKGKLQPKTTSFYLKKWAISFGILLALGSIFVWNQWYSDGETVGDTLKVSPTISQDKSIAILPFTNMSADPNSDYFCDGMMEDILTNLAKIKELKVISRTSSMQYKRTNKSIPEIAKELGVSYVVEGSVRRQGNQVRITAQLIRAGADSHLWAEQYNKTLDDVFKIQSEVSLAIADQLHLNISSNERQLIETVMTDNKQAYDYYLQGNYEANFYSKERNYAAINLYKKAIDLDDQFVQAYVKMANTYRSIYWYNLDRSPEIISKANEYLAIATQINPNLPEVQLEQALQYYHFERAYDKAEPILEQIRIEQPNLASVYGGLAAIQRRTNRWEMALENVKKELELNPKTSANHRSQIFWILRFLRKYDDPIFKNKYDDINSIFDNANQNAFAQLTLEKDFNYKKAIEILNKRVTVKEFPWYEGYYNIHLQAGKLADLEMTFASLPIDFYISIPFITIPKSLVLAQVYHHQEKPAQAQEYARKAISFLENKLKENGADDSVFAALGMAYALNGEKEKALAASQKAIDLLPLSKDSFFGYFHELHLLWVLIYTGEMEQAMTKANYLLSIPGTLTVALLENGLVYAPLRAMPGFEEMIKKYKDEK